MTGSQRPTVKKKNCGFTLIEMAMVLMIVGLLLGGLLPTISSQVEQRNVTETRKQLDEIQQALIGFCRHQRPTALSRYFCHQRRGKPCNWHRHLRPSL